MEGLTQKLLISTKSEMQVISRIHLWLVNTPIFFLNLLLLLPAALEVLIYEVTFLCQ